MPDFDKYFQNQAKCTKILVKNKASSREIESKEKKIWEKEKNFGKEKFLRRSESAFIYMSLGGGVASFVGVSPCQAPGAACSLPFSAKQGARHDGEKPQKSPVYAGFVAFYRYKIRFFMLPACPEGPRVPDPPHLKG